MLHGCLVPSNCSWSDLLIPSKTHGLALLLYTLALITVNESWLWCSLCKCLFVSFKYENIVLLEKKPCLAAWKMINLQTLEWYLHQLVWEISIWREKKVQLLKAWSIICWVFYFFFVMLVSVLKMKKPIQGFSTSMSVVWLSVAWIMMIDYKIEKPGIMTEGTTQEMMCNFISVSEWGENNRRFWAWKHPEDISLGLLGAVAIQVGIPENISPQQLDYEWQ